MRLRYLTESVPNRDPINGNGSSVIAYEVLRNLPAKVEVDLLTFATMAVPDDVRERCASVTLLPELPHRVALARSVVSGQSIGGCARRTPASRAEVRAATEKADVTLVIGPHVAVFADDIVGPAVFQTVDPWSHQLRMQAAATSGAHGLYRQLKAGQALRYERRLPGRLRLLTVSRQDAETWSRELGREVTAVPVGADPVADPWVPPPGESTICFVGSLNYGPNVESVEVLAGEIAPRLPGTRVLIAGRQPVPSVTALASDRVEIRANVPNMQDVFRSAHVAVFPDRSGLGIRNAVSEALATGMPVVASRRAAREQPDHPRLYVAEDDDDLVRLVREVLDRTTGTTAADTRPERTWAVVANEYLRECEAAMAVARESTRVGG
jgi:glycosyltransferase involved in cell wall biosynthesis